MNHRQRLLRVLGSMGTRDYKSPEEMLSGKQFYDLLLANEPKEEEPKRKKRKSNDTVRLDETPGPEIKGSPVDEDRAGGGDALQDNQEPSESGREVPVTRKGPGKATLKT